MTLFLHNNGQFVSFMSTRKKTRTAHVAVNQTWTVPRNHSKTNDPLCSSAIRGLDCDQRGNEVSAGLQSRRPTQEVCR